jgi:hypothetical protein
LSIDDRDKRKPSFAWVETLLRMQRPLPCEVIARHRVRPEVRP